MDIDLSTRPGRVTTDDGITILIGWNREWTHPSEYDASARHVERGICAHIEDVPGNRDPLALAGEHEIGAYWPYLLHNDPAMPTAINGIEETEVEQAVDLLVDVARSARAVRVARAGRRDRTMKILAELAAAAKEAGPANFHARQGALSTVISRAVSENLVSDKEIAEVVDWTLNMVQAYRERIDHPDNFIKLDEQGFADRLGITLQSLRSARSRGNIPDPDAPIGNRPGWLLTTVEEHARNRPRRGARTDLA